MTDSGAQNEKSRSVNDATKSFVRFFNKTERQVDIVWLNYEGRHVRYKTLSPRGFVDVNTYVTHPWVFFDSETKDRLVVTTGEVFMPEPWFARYGQSLLGLPLDQIRFQPTERTQIYITIPLFSLRDRALQVLRNNLGCPDDAYKLEIPASLQRELAKLIRESNQTPFGVVHND